VRISLPYQLKQDFADAIAAALKLHILSPAEEPDPASGLSSDDFVIAHITDTIAGCSRDAANDYSFLLNGYPQNIIQAQSLDMALAEKGETLSAALISDTPKSLQNREKRSLIRYYRSQNKLILFDDTSSVEDVCSKIVLIHEKRRTPAVVK
jgi:adenylate kinase family enzyme